MSKKGILLVNVGTPDAPTPDAVGRYLREFLMDPWVIDIPAPLRWILVNLLIVPKRKYASAKAYEKVWTPEGSPLLTLTASLTRKLRALKQGTGGLSSSALWVDFAMRYGKPSIASRVREAIQAGVEELFVVPMYPQYSLAATFSGVTEVERCVDAEGGALKVSAIEDFFEAPEFIEPLSDRIEAQWKRKPYDFLLFSYHGLPVRQVKKTDPSGERCLGGGRCCDSIVPETRYCYRAQAFATTRALVSRLESSVGLRASQYATAFQSRLGRTPWIRPYSDHFYKELPSRGVKRLAVVCPSFTTDCLETLEEVAIRGKADFIAAGGIDFDLIPCLNDGDAWVKSLSTLIDRHSSSSGLTL